MPDDSTSSSTAVADKPASKYPDSITQDELALAKIDQMEMSAPIENADAPDDSATTSADDYADQGGASAPHPHEESEMVEIDIRELEQQQKDEAAAAAALAREQAAFQAFAAGSRPVQSPVAPPTATIPTVAPVTPAYIPTLSSEPDASAAQALSTMQRQELTPAKQQVVSKYMLSPPTGQSQTMASVTPTSLMPPAIPEAPRPIFAQQSLSPRTTAAGFGSVARSVPDGLSAPPSQPQPAPAPLLIQPPSPELTPTAAATVNPVSLTPFSATLKDTAAPVTPAPEPPQPITQVLPELRTRKAQKIYSHNTKAVWATNYRMKLVSITVWVLLAVIMIGLLYYWTSIGSPTRLTDWPLVKQLLGT